MHTGEPKNQLPRWQRDFERFLPLKSQFVLSGNVRDLQVVEVQPGVVSVFSLPVVSHLVSSRERIAEL